MLPGFDSELGSYVGEVCCWFFLCSESFFPGYSGFPISSKTNTSKFQFDAECALHELLARDTGNLETTPHVIDLKLIVSNSGHVDEVLFISK